MPIDLDKAGPWRSIRAAAAGAGLVLILVASPACGKKGAPSPPLPRGPLAPKGVVARQLGDGAVVLFRVPSPRDQKPSEEPVRAELLRVAYPPGVQPGPDPDAFRRRGELVGTVEGLTPEGRFAIEDRTWEPPSGTLGLTLRYAVRLRDARNRPSALAVAPDLVPLASRSAVTILAAEPTADGVRLSWKDPVPEEAGVGYNVYRGEPGQAVPEIPLHTEPLRATEYLDAEVTAGRTYVYEVREALAPGSPPREGPASEPREVLAEDRFAPAAPSGLVGVQEGLAVRLFWNPGRERDIAGYRLERRRDLAEWEEATASLLASPSWLDGPVAVGERLSYRVAAVDQANNQSPWSPPADVDISAEPLAPERDER